MPSARRTPASGPMCPPAGSAIVDLPNLTTTTEPMMRTRQPTTTTLEDQRIPVRAKLAAAWTSFMFLYAYVDIIAFFKPGVVPDILAGKVWEFDVSQTLLTTFLALMAIPIFMIVLSMTLPARANRITNLIVASVQVPYAAFNVVGESWTYFYGLGVVLDVILLALILRYAWIWPRTAPWRPWRPWRPARTVKPFAPNSKREPKSSPRPVRSHLPRRRGVGLLAVGHQLPLGRRVGAFQGPYRQVRSSDAHTGPPHRRHRPQARQRRRPRHWYPPRRADVWVRQSLPITQEVPGHDHHTNRVRETGSGSHGPILRSVPTNRLSQHLDRSSGSRQVSQRSSSSPRYCAAARSASLTR